MRAPQSRPVFRRAAGVGAIALGATMAVGLAATAFKVWSWLGVHHWLSAARVLWGLQLQSELGLVVVAILGTWLSYGLWRLADGRPGTSALRLAFVLTLGSWIIFAGAASALTFGAGLSQAEVQVLYILGPQAFRLIASLPLAYGLVRSGLASRPIAWLAVAATILGGANAALTAPAYWDMTALGPTRFGMAVARFQWADTASQLLYIVFWIALGFALLRTPETLTQAAPPAAGVRRPTTGTRDRSDRSDHLVASVALVA
jgi:hypothetical protein